MPTHPLLKATLLKETYGPLVDLDGTGRDQAVHVLQRSLSLKDRRFLELVAPKVFPVRELQQRPWRSKAGLRVTDLVNVYEKMIAESKRNPSRMANHERDGQLYSERKSARRPFSTPAAILSGYRKSLFKDVVSGLDERIVGKNKTPSVSLGIQQQGQNSTQQHIGTDVVNGKKERSPRTGGDANLKHPSDKNSEEINQVTDQVERGERNHSGGTDGHFKNNSLSTQPADDSGIPHKSKIDGRHPAVASGPSGLSDSDQSSSAKAHDDANFGSGRSAELSENERSNENAGVSWRSPSNASSRAIAGAASRTQSMPTGIAATAMLDTGREQAADSPKQLQARKAAGKSIDLEEPHYESPSFQREMPLEARKRCSQYFNELLSDNLEDGRRPSPRSILEDFDSQGSSSDRDEPTTSQRKESVENGKSGADRPELKGFAKGFSEGLQNRNECRNPSQGSHASAPNTHERILLTNNSGAAEENLSSGRSKGSENNRKSSAESQSGSPARVAKSLGRSQSTNDGTILTVSKKVQSRNSEVSYSTTSPKSPSKSSALSPASGPMMFGKSLPTEDCTPSFVTVRQYFFRGLSETSKNKIPTSPAQNPRSSPAGVLKSVGRSLSMDHGRRSFGAGSKMAVRSLSMERGMHASGLSPANNYRKSSESLKSPARVPQMFGIRQPQEDDTDAKTSFSGPLTNGRLSTDSRDENYRPPARTPKMFGRSLSMEDGNGFMDSKGDVSGGQSPAKAPKRFERTVSALDGSHGTKYMAAMKDASNGRSEGLANSQRKQQPAESRGSNHRSLARSLSKLFGIRRSGTESRVQPKPGSNAVAFEPHRRSFAMFPRLFGRSSSAMKFTPTAEDFFEGSEELFASYYDALDNKQKLSRSLKGSTSERIPNSSGPSKAENEAFMAAWQNFLNSSSSATSSPIDKYHRSRKGSASERIPNNRPTTDIEAFTAEWNNYINYSSTKPSSRRSTPATPEKLGSIGRTARIQPTVEKEREKAKSTQQSQQHKVAGGTLRDELLQDVKAGGRTPSRKSHQRSQTFSRIEADDLKKGKSPSFFRVPFMGALKRAFSHRHVEVKKSSQAITAWLDASLEVSTPRNKGEVRTAKTPVTALLDRSVDVSSSPKSDTPPKSSPRRRRSEKTLSRSPRRSQTGSSSQRRSPHRIAHRRSPARSPRSSPRRKSTPMPSPDPRVKETRSSSRRPSLRQVMSDDFNFQQSLAPPALSAGILEPETEKVATKTSPPGPTEQHVEDPGQSDDGVNEVWRSTIPIQYRGPHTTSSRFRRELSKSSVNATSLHGS